MKYVNLGDLRVSRPGLGWAGLHGHVRRLHRPQQRRRRVDPDHPPGPPHQDDPIDRGPGRRRLPHGQPRFTDENFTHDLAVADQVEVIAAEAGATPAQVALAWLLAKGEDIAPIPGTKRVTRLEENVATDDLRLTADQIATLDQHTPAAGQHHNEAQMRLPER